MVMKPNLPVEMRNDPSLNHLDISGPFGKSHDEVRRAYYNIRDGKAVQNERLEEDFDFLCHRSPGLFRRTDDTPSELNVICGVVGHYIATVKSVNQGS